MQPIPRSPNTELSSLIEASGLDDRDFALCLDVSHQSLRDFLSGRRPTPEGVISDCHQLVADVESAKSGLQSSALNYKEILYYYKTAKGAKFLLDNSESLA